MLKNSLERKNQIIYFVSLVQFLARCIKFWEQLTNRFKHVLNPKTTSNFTEVEFLKAFKISLPWCPQTSRPIMSCLWQYGVHFRKWKKPSNNWPHSHPPRLQTESFLQKVYKKATGNPHSSCRCDGPFKVNRQDTIKLALVLKWECPSGLRTCESAL